jgi:hypothetical protein
MDRDAECAWRRFMVRPLQGRIPFNTSFRGLAPTAIHVHPLRGWECFGTSPPAAQNFRVDSRFKGRNLDADGGTVA